MKCCKINCFSSLLRRSIWNVTGTTTESHLCVTIANDRGVVKDLAVKLALAGYTMSFYVAGMNQAVDKAMREAMRRRTGMFNVPEEVFLHPFRPWGLRQRWTDLGSSQSTTKLAPKLDKPTRTPRDRVERGCRCRRSKPSR